VLKVRLARGITDIADAAKQLGIPTGAYPLLEAGRLMPAPWLLERLKRWLWEGVSFEGHKHPASYHAEALGKNWIPLRIMLAPKQRKLLRAEGERIGLTSEELVAIAVDRLLSAPVVLSTLKAAQDAIRKAQMVEALKLYPDLRVILEGDIDLACKIAGPEVRPSPAPKLGLEQLVEQIDEVNREELDDENATKEKTYSEWDETT